MLLVLPECVELLRAIRAGFDGVIPHGEEDANVVDEGFDDLRRQFDRFARHRPDIEFPTTERESNQKDRPKAVSLLVHRGSERYVISDLARVARIFSPHHQIAGYGRTEAAAV